jgi:hypothetical protein
MFRGGGKVSSYGNGIASGLAKPKRGLVDEPGGYAGENFLISQGLYDEFLRGKPVGTSTTTGGNILSQNIKPMQGPNLSPQMQAIQNRLATSGMGTARNRFLQGALNLGGKFVGANPLTAMAGLTAATFAPVAGLAAANAPETIEELQVMQQYGPIDEGFTEDMIKQYEADRAEARRTGTPLGTGGTGLTSSDEELQKILDSQVKKTNEVPQDDEFKNTIIDTEETTELTVDDYIDLLGGKKARQRDVSDLFARISASALKRGERGEGKRTFADIASDVMAAEAAAGPSRLEKIEQTAGMLDIKDRQATKRALEQVDLMKAQEIFRRDISKGSVLDQYREFRKTESKPAAIQSALVNSSPAYGNKQFEILEEKDAKNKTLTENDIGKVLIIGNKAGGYTVIEIISDPSIEGGVNKRNILSVA